MALGITLIVILALVAFIWIFVEVKRFRHKAVALFLIVLILFSYLSFLATIKGKDVDFRSVEGIKEAGQLYFSWLGSVFGNLKTLTSNAINMDWSANKSKSKLPE